MPEIRKKYDREFREGAVRIVEETGKPIAQVARDLGVVEGTLGNWVKLARESRDGSSGLSKDDIKKIIAYSSISHLGYVMLGLLSLDLVGIQGAIIQMVRHGLVAGGLFLMVGMIYERCHTRELKA